MDLVKLAMLFASLTVPVAAQQSTGQAQMPRPSDELVALSRIPLLEIRVTDAAGQPNKPRAAVNWRGLPNGLSGGSATDGKINEGHASSAGGAFLCEPHS
jgi:hypothetical protein